MANFANMNCEEFIDYMDSEDFENFKSNVCHTLKSVGDLPFLIIILKMDVIRYCYKKDKLLECYYFLGLVDYLCRVNGLPCDKEYSDIREFELSERVFPGGTNILCSVFGNDEPKKEAIEKAIPEFLRFNIVEWGIRDVA
jgi:hypothetical protein